MPIRKKRRKRKNEHTEKSSHCHGNQLANQLVEIQTNKSHIRKISSISQPNNTKMNRIGFAYLHHFAYRLVYYTFHWYFIRNINRRRHIHAHASLGQHSMCERQTRCSPISGRREGRKRVKTSQAIL